MGRGGKCKPVTVAGVTYGSYKEAADALGMSPALLSLRLKRGIDPTLPVHRYTPTEEVEDKRGRRPATREPKRMRLKGIPGPAPKPVMVDGHIYESTAEAAVKLGTSPEYLQNCLCHGSTCRGHEVCRPEEIDLVLAEIEERNKQPYQFTR